MTEFLQTLHQEYAQFQARFGARLLGVVEIGSFARGEAVRFSDHDLRLILHCNAPLLVFNEHPWTEGIDAAVTTVGHIVVHLWQLDETPTYEFAVLRSYAAAFWRWLVDSAAEFGAVVVGPS